MTTNPRVGNDNGVNLERFRRILECITYLLPLLLEDWPNVVVIVVVLAVARRNIMVGANTCNVSERER